MLYQSFARNLDSIKEERRTYLDYADFKLEACPKFCHSENTTAIDPERVACSQMH